MITAFIVRTSLVTVLLHGSSTAPPSAARPEPSAPVRAALADLPAHGSGARHGEDDGHCWMVASGTGVFMPRSEAERSLPDPLKRARAIRAAVVDAKVAAASLLGVGVDGGLTARTDDSSSIRSDVVARQQRSTLCAMRLWNAEVQPDEGGLRARVLLWASDWPEPATASGGVPSFPDEQAAAEAIVEWVRDGLCTDGTVRVFVGRGEAVKLRMFGVGLGATEQQGAKVAEIRARSGMLGDRPSAVSGQSALSRQSRADPLSPEGSAALLEERFFSERAVSSVGIVRDTGRVCRALPNGITACVLWGECSDPDKP